MFVQRLRVTYLLLALVVGCAPSQGEVDLSKPIFAEPYRIGVGDTLTVDVHRTEEVSRTIAASLSGQINDPMVTTAVTSAQTNPPSVPYRNTMTALDVVSAAGDVNEFARSAQMKTVVSKDGTPIAYERRGRGPVLVLVHGAGSDHSGWETVLDVLDDEFTVFAIDRRGRGASGDARDYAIEREYEDVTAVIGAAGEPVFLLGHSFGGICAMETALRVGGSVRKLVVYEPPTNVPGADATVAPYDALLASGKANEVVERFYRERVLVPDNELAMLRASPSWSARVASAHTIPREVRAVFAYRLDTARWAGLRVPTLILLGGDSPPRRHEGMESLTSTIPGSRLVVMPGQQHNAMTTAPELFVREVRRFLQE